MNVFNNIKNKCICKLNKFKLKYKCCLDCKCSKINNNNIGVLFPEYINSVMDKNDSTNNVSKNDLINKNITGKISKSVECDWSTKNNPLGINITGDPNNWNQGKCGCCYIFGTTWALMSILLIHSINNNVITKTNAMPIVPSLQALVMGCSLVGYGQKQFDIFYNNNINLYGGCNGGFPQYTISCLSNKNFYGSGLITQKLGNILGYYSNEEFINNIRQGLLTNYCGCLLPSWLYIDVNGEIFVNDKYSNLANICDNGNGTSCFPGNAPPENLYCSGNQQSTDRTLLLSNLFKSNKQPGFFFKGPRTATDNLNYDGMIFYGYRSESVFPDKNFSNDDMTGYLENVGPIPIVINASNNTFYKSNSNNNIIDNSLILGPLGGQMPDHVVHVCGFKYINKELYWIIQNSWGSQWGDNGKCYLKSSTYPMNCFFQIVLLETNSGTNTPTILNLEFIKQFIN